MKRRKKKINDEKERKEMTVKEEKGTKTSNEKNCRRKGIKRRNK
jgi:hypothetical protein